jgi:hypothetical protein
MQNALDHAVRRAQMLWDFTHSRGPIARLLRWFGGMVPVDGVWICRYADGDWKAAHFLGDPVQIWRYDGDGLKVVESLPQLDMKQIGSKTPVLRFCVDETGWQMIYTEWHGGIAGRGWIMQANEAGRWKERVVWIS